MEEKTGFVAVLTSNPALGAIIGMVLDCEERLNVQTFSQVERLRCHMRIAPVDMVICDHHVEHRTGTQICIELRRERPNRRFAFLLLADQVDSALKQACRFAGIDEVVVKPMSPLFIRERVISRLEKQSREPFVLPDIPPILPAAGVNNVISLHGQGENGGHPA